jgi:hypothetical protein
MVVVYFSLLMLPAAILIALIALPNSWVKPRVRRLPANGSSDRGLAVYHCY